MSKTQQLAFNIGAVVTIIGLIFVAFTNNKSDLEDSYEKISFCQDKGFNYKEVTVRELSKEVSPGASIVQLQQGIECDWFSPIKEPNKKVLYNQVAEYCRPVNENLYMSEDIFDCTDISPISLFE